MALKKIIGMILGRFEKFLVGIIEKAFFCLWPIALRFLAFYCDHQELFLVLLSNKNLLSLCMCSCWVPFLWETAAGPLLWSEWIRVVPTC